MFPQIERFRLKPLRDGDAWYINRLALQNQLSTWGLSDRFYAALGVHAECVGGPYAVDVERALETLFHGR